MIVFLHGLESKVGGDKQVYLEKKYGPENVYSPSMNYKDDRLFNKTFQYLKDKKIDVIVGSSMGGYFAYWMGKKLGVNTILLNPALPYRTSIEPTIDKSGNKSNKTHVIVGKNDDIINYKDTINWLDENHKGHLTVDLENIGHRSHYTILDKYVKKYNY